uniref:Adhesion G-protein coupled receptor D2-like n=1 Tax=Mastacembelus armatus TaxID=205130 RepID=A0A3Q3L2A1_9TELE
MLFTVLDIPKSDRTSIHKNLFITLICAQVILLCSGSAIHNKVACTLVAALLHLFFMAAFSWMLVEGLLLWSKVVAVNLSEDRHMKYYYLIGWGLPVLIVTITLASASGKYSASGYCWLSVQNGVIWGFAGPVIFIIMVKTTVFANHRAAVKAVLVLLPILGLTWLCGVLVPFSIVMAYIFILLNSLQVQKDRHTHTSLAIILPRKRITFYKHKVFIQIRTNSALSGIITGLIAPLENGPNSENYWFSH